MQPPLAPTSTRKPTVERPPVLARSLALMKPITWFGPMWAFLCGSIASGNAGWNLPDIGRILIGVIMAGPVLCGFSQVVNDYFDREIDAINEPNRLIPSGMVSIVQVMLTAIALFVVGIGMGLYLGQPVALAAAVGTLMAVMYSAPPIRAKRNGWAGNTLVAFSYEGLAWITGHLAFGTLTTGSILLAVLYSLGAHGIMSINDYKSIDGDRASGILTIPVQYGRERAARLIVVTMVVTQLAVLAAFLFWGQWIVAAIIGVIIMIQIPTQREFLADPANRFIRFSAIGVSFYVWGMMAAAIGLRFVG